MFFPFLGWSLFTLFPCFLLNSLLIMKLFLFFNKPAGNVVIVISVGLPDESIYLSIYLSHRKAMMMCREKKAMAWILTTLSINTLRCYYIQTGILSNSMFIYRNLTRGVGRFRELLRAVETRTTQNLRMVSCVKPHSYCSICILVGR